jgi:hypothetical protein
VISCEVELCAMSSSLFQFRCPPTGKCVYVLWSSHVQPQIHIVYMVETDIVHGVAHGQSAHTKGGMKTRLVGTRTRAIPKVMTAHALQSTAIAALSSWMVDHP